MISSLLQDFNKFQDNVLLDSSLDILDLSNINFVSPTILLPSLNFARQNSMKIKVHPNTSDYIKRVLGIINGPKTTLKFRELPKKRSDNNRVVKDMVNLLDHDYGGSRTLWHVLNEMVNNVIDHSQSENGYTYSQKYPIGGAIDMSFFDNGISIPGSYEEADISFKNDCDAIDNAINGISTKEKDEDDPRGYGMNTTAQLITKGNNGDMLVVSRGGLCYINQLGKKYNRLVKDKFMQGTLVSIRIKRNQVQNFDSYMDYDKI